MYKIDFLQQYFIFLNKYVTICKNHIVDEAIFLQFVIRSGDWNGFGVIFPAQTGWIANDKTVLYIEKTVTI